MDSKSPEDEMLYLIRRYQVVRVLKKSSRRIEWLRDVIKSAVDLLDVVCMVKMKNIVYQQDPELIGSLKVCETSNNSIFIGFLKDNCSEWSFGLLHEKDFEYFGEWNAGAFEGFGVMKKGDTFYGGQFFRGKRDGTGRLTTRGEEYIGLWKDDKKHGVGKLISRRGVEYEGQFVNDKMEGVGVYSKGVGNSLKFNYRGSFLGGVFHGFGTYETLLYDLVGHFSEGIMQDVDMTNKKSGEIIHMVIPLTSHGKTYKSGDGEWCCPSQILQRQLDDMTDIYTRVVEVGCRLDEALQSHRGGYVMW